MFSVPPVINANVSDTLQARDESAAPERSLTLAYLSCSKPAYTSSYQYVINLNTYKPMKYECEKCPRMRKTVAVSEQVEYFVKFQ